MSIVEKKQTERINLRLKSEAKSILERAAGFEGKTVSSFIINCALEKAKKTVRSHEIMVLNAQNSKTFIEALSVPVNFNQKLSEALEEHGKRVSNK
jgi:uncharacterized protein (DUF1778 family)